MVNQTPSLGRIVHFVRDGLHMAAVITAPFSRLEHDGIVASGQTLRVWPPMDAPFNVVAALDDSGADETWHWPEYVP